MGSTPPEDRGQTEAVTGLIPFLPTTDRAACKAPGAQRGPSPR